MRTGGQNNKRHQFKTLTISKRKYKGMKITRRSLLQIMAMAGAGDKEEMDKEMYI